MQYDKLAIFGLLHHPIDSAGCHNIHYDRSTQSARYSLALKQLFDTLCCQFPFLKLPS